jgi:integrase
LPVVVKNDLVKHLQRVRAQHQRDLATGGGWVELPGALARKLPLAGRDWAWQWVFPVTRHYTHRETGQRRRHDLHETVVQQAVRGALLAAGIPKRATCHSFRHYSASRTMPSDVGANCASAEVSAPPQRRDRPIARHSPVGSTDC